MTATFRSVSLAPSKLAEALWAGAMVLQPGDEAFFHCSSAAEAKRLQRWFFRERKRAIRDLLNTTPGLDPSAADVLRGIVTWLDGSILVLARQREAFLKVSLLEPGGPLRNVTKQSPESWHLKRKSPHRAARRPKN